MDLLVFLWSQSCSRFSFPPPCSTTFGTKEIVRVHSRNSLCVICFAPSHWVSEHTERTGWPASLGLGCRAKLVTATGLAGPIQTSASLARRLVPPGRRPGRACSVSAAASSEQPIVLAGRCGFLAARFCKRHPAVCTTETTHVSTGGHSSDPCLSSPLAPSPPRSSLVATGKEARPLLAQSGCQSLRLCVPGVGVARQVTGGRLVWKRCRRLCCHQPGGCSEIPR